MDQTRIILSGLWVALMLTYLLGDVLRVFSGSFTAGEIDGREAAEWMWVVAALVMFIPIALVIGSLTVPLPVIRWVTIVATIALVLFNLAGLPYERVFDNLLIALGFGINGLILWYAWTWA